MTKFRANIFIIILVTILGIIVFNIIGELRDNKVSQQKKDIITETKEEVEDMTEIINQLESEIHKINKLLVLEGNCTSEVTYNDKDIHEDTNENFKWIKDKFTEWKSRELTVSAKYEFGFSYNMENIRIITEGEDIIIELSRNDINLEYLEYLGEDSYLVQDVGWLSKGDFTPQEVNVLQERVKIATFNSVQNKREYRDKAIQGIIDNIESICNKLGIKVKCRVSDIDVVENDDAKIHN
ncbi:hypothetical protein [uncultured Clostridium sp.]|uniref:hypothetical protein n=1 Tax=uncultured Clostridium sp. TaxID=59620 RepID=UPI00321622F3